MIPPSHRPSIERFSTPSLREFAAILIQCLIRGGADRLCLPEAKPLRSSIVGASEKGAGYYSGLSAQIWLLWSAARTCWVRTDSEPAVMLSTRWLWALTTR